MGPVQGRLPRGKKNAIAQVINYHIPVLIAAVRLYYDNLARLRIHCAISPSPLPLSMRDVVHCIRRGFFPNRAIHPVRLRHLSSTLFKKIGFAFLHAH